MCSILAIIASYIILFVVTSDLVNFCLAPPVLANNWTQNDYANKKESRQASPLSGQIELVPFQKGYQDILCAEVGCHQVEITNPPFQRSSFFGSDHRSNEPVGTATMEMYAVQAHMQRHTRTLCQMRTVMEGCHGPELRPADPSCCPQTSSLGIQSMDGASGLGRNPVGQIPTQKAVSKAKNQKRELSSIEVERQRTASPTRRFSAVWTAILTTMPALDPPWMSTLAPPANVPSGPTPASTTVDGKEDKDKQMRSLVAALRKHQDNLPDDVQALMKDVAIRTGQEETKQLHAAVTQHGRAKKEVADAQAARLHMHTTWKNFLAQSVQQWTTYTNQFLSQEKQLMERLKQAQESLVLAKENLGSCKSAAGLAPKDDASMASDTEEALTKDVESAAGQKIAASFQDLATNLQALHTQAVQAVQLEADQQDQMRKRPRLDSPGEKDPPADANINTGFGEGE